MHLPTPAEFETLKLTLFHVFDLILWVLAMVTVVLVALTHMPKFHANKRKGRRVC